MLDWNAQDPARPHEIRKRQAAAVGGFRCDVQGCGRSYDRQSELHKHAKYHVPEYERPLQCATCPKRFHFRKDLKRHEETQHKETQHTPTTPTTLCNASNGDLESYSYSPLQSETSTRLLTIHPGRQHTAVVCSLETIDLADNITETGYEALSYAWGSPQEEMTIRVDDRTMLVPRDAYITLTRLRSQEKKRTFWVAPICIHWEDVQERGQQVATMGQIYRNATSVSVWLGEHCDDSELAMRFIQDTIPTPGTSSSITSSPEYAKEWEAVAALLRRPWFSRRWSVQEISLARRATVHCGADSASWEDFEVAIELHAARIRLLYNEVEAMGATQLVQAKSELFERNGDHETIEHRYSLADLVMKLSNFEAKDIHELICPLLSLAKDTHYEVETNASVTDTPLAPSQNRSLSASAGQMRQRDALPSTTADTISDCRIAKRARIENPTTSGGGCSEKASESYTREIIRLVREVSPQSYNEDTFEVCRQILSICLSRATTNHNLDILCRPWAPIRGSEELPSWILTIDEGAFKARSGKQIARTNHDSLVCRSPNASSVVTAYDACRNQRAKTWSFGNMASGDHKFSLFVEGFAIDEIGEIGTFSSLANVPHEWFRLAGWDPWDDLGNRMHSDRAPERLWRTLVANRDLDGRRAPVSYAIAFESAIDESTRENGIETMALAKQSDPLQVEFLKRVAAVVWNRKLFKSARNHNLLGLAPKKALKGDGRRRFRESFHLHH